jgi:N-acetylmuramoyl-L-alanine amidase CwlA
MRQKACEIWHLRYKWRGHIFLESNVSVYIFVRAKSRKQIGSEMCEEKSGKTEAVSINFNKC